jgi:diguanylate cyclase (GGDEF)-like protein
MMLDIDDFKRVNDVCGHAEGDEVLQAIAALLRRTVRAADVVCRVGGEEFAVILPGCSSEVAVDTAHRLGAGLAGISTDAGGEVTLSVGVARGPEHAMNARELLACAESAMMTAKAQGKDRVVVFEDARAERPLDGDRARDIRSIAHLKLLQSLARKLGRLSDVTQIGEAIVGELRMLVDYHNCVVYLLEGRRLVPVAVRGHLESVGYEQLEFGLGEGLTGHVAETGKPMLVANVLESDLCIQLTEGAGDESLASAPLRHGQRVTGAITMSKLGAGQLDDDDLRLLEVVAGHASVALENARLYESARREAENATAWLEFSDALAEARSVEAVGDQAVRAIASVMEVDQASIWIEDAVTGDFRCLASLGYDADPLAAAVPGLRTSRANAARLIGRHKTPFTIDAARFREILGEDAGAAAISAAAIAPLDAGFGIRGWITVRAPDDDLARFADERLRLLEGLAYRASVALQKTVLLQSEQQSAEITGALLEFSRRLAGTAAADLRGRIVELAAEMLGSARTWLWLEQGRPGTFAIEAAWREDGARPMVPVGSVVELAGTRQALERGTPFLLAPGASDLVPAGDEPLAVAPVVLPSGRIGCIAATVSEAFPERKLRLLAGIANQASLALHISRPDRSSRVLARGVCHPVSETGTAPRVEHFVHMPLELSVVEGDIAALDVDAVANAANDRLWMGAGVAGALKRAGGEEIEREAVAKGPIAVGDAVATGAGKLPARWVIHAVVMGQDLRTSPEAIESATRRTLEIADDLGAGSLALPAFGTGVGGFPLDECARLMASEVKEYEAKSLRYVVFAVYGAEAERAFTSVC